jgi:DNA-binding MarR family transcriptional regulator
LTRVSVLIIVHSMNSNETTTYIPDREVVEFQGLIEALFQCCQERMQYQSERFGLPEAELRCLLQFRNERYLTAKGLAGRMNVAKSRVTKLVDGLLRRKLVERTVDPDDSRVKLLKLSSGGEKLVVEIISFRGEMYLKVLDQFSPEQRSHLLNGLSQLRRSMESVKEMLI